MSKIRVMSVFGTRPEAIKMAPVVRELARREQFESLVCVTAQHREMLDQVLSLFGIRPDVDLNLMRPGQSLAGLTASIFEKLDPVFARFQPDWVLVQGDTTTVMAAALLAYYHRIQVGHVEAGLRTGDKWQPFPEEINRRVAGVAADLHFAPTEVSRQNLLREGVPGDKVAVTGNTVIDALLHAAAQPYDMTTGPLAGLPLDRRIILVTAHRRENFGAPFEDLCHGLRDVAERFGPSTQIVYPVHLNPNVQEPVRRILSGVENISLLPPLDYLPMVHLMKRATLVLTDSGGLQEEAPGLGKPVLVMREVTERPEGVAAGVAKLLGTNPQRIFDEVHRLLTDEAAYRAMVGVKNPYGDGHAARYIVDAIECWQQQRSRKRA